MWGRGRGKRARAGRAEAVAPPRGGAGEGRSRFVRFEDVQLQAELYRQLEVVDVPWRRGDDGEVAFRAQDERAVTAAVARVREGRFSSYVLACPDPERAARLRQQLRARELAHLVEYTDSGVRFAVPRADEAVHEELFAAS